MKVAIAGSRRLPAGQAPRLLVRFLAALPEDAIILMRRPASIDAMPGMFEIDVSGLASILHLDVEWFKPAPTDRHPGRASVFLRDVEMVSRADLVLLFFASEDVEPGTSGTSHLFDQALQQNRPVYAYAVAADGKVSRVGEYDPEHLYANIAPSA